MALALLALAGCTTQRDIDRIGAMSVADSLYLKALHREFVTLAALEYAEKDWLNVDAFIDRAHRAAVGEDVQPDLVEGRWLHPESVAALSAARAALIEVLVEEAKLRLPDDAAHALAAFDCWLEEQVEGHQPDDINYCRREFETALAKVQAALQASLFMLLPDLEGEIGQITVQGAGGEQTLDQAPQATEINYRLSLKRAEAVRDLLVATGVDANVIEVASHGESNPVVATEDDVDEPRRNRRVEVTVR